MTEVSDKFGFWIKNGFDLYKNNIIVLSVAFLLAFLLSTFSLGILFGPMTAGMVYVVLQLKDEGSPQPSAGDVFHGFKYFLPSLLFSLVWGVGIFIACLILVFIPCIGQLGMLCLSLAAATFLMFGFYLIVDKEMDFWTASMTSFSTVKPAFFPFLGLMLVASILGQIGSIICGLGVVVTMPLYFTIVSEAYCDVFYEATPPPIQEDEPVEDTFEQKMEKEPTNQDASIDGPDDID